jgi:hypothetical protein
MYKTEPSTRYENEEPTRVGFLLRFSTHDVEGAYRHIRPFHEFALATVIVPHPAHV